MNDISKSIRVGTIDFFGIMIPGLLIITICSAGFFVPLVSVVIDLSQSEMIQLSMGTNGTLLIIFLLVVFSYMLGYILRLTSPDSLDRKSAIHVIWGECKKNSLSSIPISSLEWIRSLKYARRDIKKWAQDLLNKRQLMEEWIEKDGWPFNPGNPKDKFPYLKFREYLIKRGHGELVEELIAWKNENEDDSAPIKTSNSKKSPIKPKRSKSHINMMKMSIRLYCPDLSLLVESKEAHIRLMSGTWAAFKFAQWPVWLALIVLGAISFARQSLEARLHVQIPDHNYLVYVFINVNLLLIMFFCNQRIEKLFHYRRVSELFHIVQAAHFAHEFKEQRNKIT